MSNLNNQIITATKWSAITELLAKIASPITTMLLARLLAPEAFGVVATVTMLVTFAEVFTDAGFQKYIMQHEFSDDDDKDLSVSVAFTYNLMLSVIIWIIIFSFRFSIAYVIGATGQENAIAVASLSIPIASFSSIQFALYRRNLDFKTLFYVRIICSFLPFLITIPLAYIYRSYWALIIGTLVGNLVQSMVLTLKSSWKPRISVNIQKLRSMLSFCGWTLFDSILSWCTWYMDIFFVGVLLNEYYLGVYKTSMSLVSNIMNLAYASFFPILIPALAKLQNDIPALNRTLLKFQKVSCLVILPLGIIIFAYRDLITNIILGPQWIDAASFIGLWAIIDVFVVLFTRFTGSAFVAIGKPKISVIDNVLHLIVLLPAIYIAAHYDFQTLYVTRSLVRLEGVLVAFILTYYTLKLTPWKMIINILPEVISGLSILAIAKITSILDPNIYISIVFIVFSIIVYISLLLCFKNDREIIKKLYNHVTSTILKQKEN